MSNESVTGNEDITIIALRTLLRDSYQENAALKARIKYLKAELDVAHTKPGGPGPLSYMNPEGNTKPISAAAGGIDVRPEGWDSLEVNPIQFNREVRNLEERLHPEQTPEDDRG